MNKYSYKAILSYKGTRYSGWQNQADNPMTIQNQVEQVVAKIVNYQDYQVIGASRTDTGVHAQGQVLKIILPKDIAADKLKQGINSKLPEDIKVLDIESIDEKFNVNQDVVSKEYNYFFSFAAPNAALSEAVLYLLQKLDITKMQKACELIIGEHDFAGLSVKGSREGDAIRTITCCSIEKTSFSPFSEEVYYLKIEANGFVKYMVRFIMSALISIGKNEVTLADLANCLETGEDFVLKKKAPASGLHLMKIHY